MADLFDNPMGLLGFEFVEFASPTPGVLEPVFEMMGFTKVARHRSKNVTLYRQGDINFIINAEPRAWRRISPPNTGLRPAAWRFACATRARRMSGRSNWAPSRWKCVPARWSCTCRRSRALVARRCT